MNSAVVELLFSGIIFSSHYFALGFLDFSLQSWNTWNEANLFWNLILFLSVHHCRRRIIQHIKADLAQELDFCREMIEGNPKNYQVWSVLYWELYFYELYCMSQWVIKLQAISNLNSISRLLIFFEGDTFFKYKLLKYNSNLLKFLLMFLKL